jgi:hypothetical protein
MLAPSGAPVNRSAVLYFRPARSRTCVRVWSGAGYPNDNNRKGAVAEIELVLAAMKLGVPVLKPVAEHGRCDLALDIGGKLWRVQCNGAA